MVAVLLLASLSAGATAIAEDYQYPPAHGVQRASEFETFRVHFAGKAVDGLPLKTVIGGPEKRRTFWSFLYGGCHPAPCTAPLQIQTFSTCKRYRDIYPGEQSSFPFRGAQASRDGGASLEIYTGRVTIAIFGDDDATIDEAASSYGGLAILRMSGSGPRRKGRCRAG